MTLKKYIEVRGFKQCAVAKKIRVDPPRLCKHLNGWLLMTETQQARLAKYLKLSVREIQTNQVLHP